MTAEERQELEQTEYRRQQKQVDPLLHPALYEQPLVKLDRELQQLNERTA